MTPEYIIRKSLCRPAFCSDATIEQRASRIEDIQHSHAYADGQGYDQPTKGILFANWNYFARGLDTILERYGYQIEWNDEWSTCSDCNKAIRTSPDSYGWQPAYVLLECDILCLECLDAESYLESLEDKPTRAVNVPSIDPAKHGYRRLQDGFQNGFHPGQTDNPRKIHAELVKQGHKRILFQVDAVGQFDVNFSVWEKVPEALEASETSVE